MKFKKMFLLIFVVLLISHSLSVVSADPRRGRKRPGKSKKIKIAQRTASNIAPTVGAVSDSILIAKELGVIGEEAE
nr:venom polypeptide precursor [Doratifera vulnerans]